MCQRRPARCPHANPATRDPAGPPPAADACGLCRLRPAASPDPTPQPPTLRAGQRREALPKPGRGRGGGRGGLAPHRGGGMCGKGEGGATYPPSCCSPRGAPGYI